MQSRKRKSYEEDTKVLCGGTDECTAADRNIAGEGAGGQRDSLFLHDHTQLSASGLHVARPYGRTFASVLLLDSI